MSMSSHSFPSEENKDNLTQSEENSTLPFDSTESSEPSQPGAVSPPVVAEPASTETLPPEAQGEANGGPLGCCLGTMVGLLLSLSIAIASRFYASPLASVLHSNLSTAVRVVMAIVAIISVIICGYFGWKIGTALYHEYEDPRLRQQRQKRQQRKPTSPRIS